MYFDRELSQKIDLVVVLLDKCPPWWVRAALRLYKRLLERGIPR